jgi:ATP-binding cassette subfamily F protein 3
LKKIGIVTGKTSSAALRREGVTILSDSRSWRKRVIGGFRYAGDCTLGFTDLRLTTDNFSVLTVSKISKSFGGRVLFADASMQVNRGDRIGLIGPNGAGKSTLFNILLGHDQPDEGGLVLQRGMKVGFLPQQSEQVGEEAVLEVACGSEGRAAKTSKDGASTNGSDWPELANPTAEDYQLEAKAKRILKGLSFRETDFPRQAKTLSGGWIMRAHLARLLVLEPDLLLLDEPTNHLDLESLVWLQSYLQGYQGALVIVSHDRSFLNALAEMIVEIDRERLVQYRGNFDSYLQQKRARQEQYEAAYKNQQREIKKLQTFIDRFGAKNTKASQAQSKRKQIARMEKIEAPHRARKQISFRFPQPPRSGLKALELKGVHHAYEKNIVYRGVDYVVERGQRTVLVGPNGAGKSTLLKLLGGVLPLQQGTRETGHNVLVGYYSQHRVEMLNFQRSVLEEAVDGIEHLPEQTVRTVLGAFLFSGDDVFKPVSVLSGGEKSRLALAKLLLNPPNVLLMDEPTTHLDMESIEALIGALQQFEGTLIFISHDVYFIKLMATSVLHIRNGLLTYYPGDYDYYIEKTAALSDRAGLVAGDNLPQQSSESKSFRRTKEQKRSEATERQMRSLAHKELQAKLNAIEDRIFQLEERQKELASALELPQVYEDSARAREASMELAAIGRELQTLIPEWEQLAIGKAVKDVSV